nr:hypothetical protein [Sphingomonas sp. CFBP 13728]
MSGELRTRVNYFFNPQGRKSEHRRQDSYRIFVGADVHIGEHFRAYGELARGPMDGKTIGSPSGTLSNTLLVQQAFVDGSNLLLANRDNNTVQTSLTGVHRRKRRGEDDLLQALPVQGATDRRVSTAQDRRLVGDACDCDGTRQPVPR